MGLGGTREMTNEPVAWLSQGGDVSRSADYFEEMGFKDLIPLYTHPHPDNLGLAESIIKQQQLEIEALKDEVAKWKMSYENNIRFEDGYGHN
jgi:hypothetical protein